MFDTWVLRRPTFFILPTLVIILALLTSSLSPLLLRSLPVVFSSLATKLKDYSPPFNNIKRGISSTTETTTTTSTSTINTAPPVSSIMPRTPVYFFSHGGPDVQYNTAHPVYPVLQRIGKEITQKVKPKAVVVFSAHWQSPSADEIHLNNAVLTDLIYDFYGFPPKFYEATFPSTGSPQLASRIVSLLSEAGIPARGLKRGLDHGVFSGFNVAFPPESNPLGCPLVQVSLFNSEDPDAHYRLGRAVAPLRDEGVVIIGTGMTVHNLRDMRFAAGRSEPLPYAVSFDNALKEAAEADPSVRQEKMREVTKRPDAKQAHPWMDHLMPIHVVAGAAGEDKGKQTWTLHEASFAWAQYRFGDLPEEEEK
ncbi:Extradiol ring-cleavage dioxygenase, class III enzyme, subunit B [Cladorrhinum samala]|uniref:Extradiol ring-cleavage dioxygenase, class III enzyme, subunit B n=1 Tax=Cladorrhinum samala TaxID=585594 RepID=A0AAV9I5G5_9PEZI|nr:Extradiol ring-cleavage dioxygenase, class III enzyme, subunit B [Cladorrhinum samala]